MTKSLETLINGVSKNLNLHNNLILFTKIFLKASAVLERQFVAYCMDSWVKRSVS